MRTCTNWGGVPLSWFIKTTAPLLPAIKGKKKLINPGSSEFELNNSFINSPSKFQMLWRFTWETQMFLLKEMRGNQYFSTQIKVMNTRMKIATRPVPLKHLLHVL